MECSLVVHVLHNLSFVAATGLPAPVFPKNRIAPYFLDNDLSKQFWGCKEALTRGSRQWCAKWTKGQNSFIRFLQEEKDGTSWTWQQGIEYSITFMNKFVFVKHPPHWWPLDNGNQGFLHTIYKMSFASQWSIKLSPHHSLKPLQLPWTLSSNSELKIYDFALGGEIVWEWVWLCAWTSGSNISFKFGFGNKWVWGWSE